MMRAILISCVFLFTACSTSQKLSRLDVGMSKSTVIEKMGEPDAVRGSIVNKYGQTIQVLEYGLVKPEDQMTQIKTYYWLFLCDDRLTQWGEAGDWKREADRIYEVRFQ